MKNIIRKIFFSGVLIAVFSLLSAVAEAQTIRTKTVRFARGKNSAVLKGAAVRGTVDRYIVRAKRGQTMRVKIASIENNANFTVYFADAPQSLDGAEEVTDWSAELDADNDYVIIVSPIRGNATYTLTVSIK